MLRYLKGAMAGLAAAAVIVGSTTAITAPAKADGYVRHRHHHARVVYVPRYVHPPYYFGRPGYYYTAPVYTYSSTVYAATPAFYYTRYAYPVYYDVPRVYAVPSYPSFGYSRGW